MEATAGRPGREEAAPHSAVHREHVVVGVHGDDASLEALRWAARHAKATGGEIEALMAWELAEPPRHLSGDLQEVAAAVINDLRWVLETIVDRSEVAATPGVRVSTTIVTAPAKAAMADAVDRADLLVLGSAHHAAAISALSVTRQMAASASCPVALVPVCNEDSAEQPRPPGEFLAVGMDGSPQALEAFRWACDEAVRRRLPLRVVTVSPTEATLDAVTGTVAMRLRAKPSIDITLVTRAGDPGEVLIEQSRGAEALVVGQHGSGTIRRRLPALGSVSRWCVAHLISPVVVVPRRMKSQPPAVSPSR